MPGPTSHCLSTLAIISGPLSDRIQVGAPSNNMALAKVSMTPIALIRRATRIARHLRVNSSISVNSHSRKVVVPSQDADIGVFVSPAASNHNTTSP